MIPLKVYYMCNSFYLKKIDKHLAYLSTYKKLEFDPIKAIRNDVFFFLDSLYGAHQVVHRTRFHLTIQKSSHIPLSYSPHKIYTAYLPSPTPTFTYTFLWPPQNPHTLHLPSPFLLQPILSPCDSSTNRFSNYVTHFMEQFVETLPLCICYSNHWIQLVQSLSLPPDNTYPHHL